MRSCCWCSKSTFCWKRSLRLRLDHSFHTDAPVAQINFPESISLLHSPCLHAHTHSLLKENKKQKQKHKYTHTPTLEKVRLARAEVASSQHRDLTSASEFHELQSRVDVTRFARRQTPLIGSLTLSGPIVCLCRRGFNRSGGGERLRTYKEVFGKTRLPPRDCAASLAVCANNVDRHRARVSKRSVGASEEEQSKVVRNHCLMRVPVLLRPPSPTPFTICSFIFGINKSEQTLSTRKSKSTANLIHKKHKCKSACFLLYLHCYTTFESKT